MPSHARFMTVAGALVALAPVAGAQRLAATPGTHSALTAFTTPLEAPAVAVVESATALPRAATLDVAPVVAPALAEPVSAPVEVAPFVATGGASFGGVDLGGTVAHETASASEERAPFAGADDDDEDESGSATAGGGMGWMPIAGAVAGGGALFAALASNGGGAATASPVTVSTGNDTRAGALPPTEFQPIAPLAPMSAPEPATYAMLGAGLAALGLVAKRRRMA